MALPEWQRCAKAVWLVPSGWCAAAGSGKSATLASVLCIFKKCQGTNGMTRDRSLAWKSNHLLHFFKGDPDNFAGKAFLRTLAGLGRLADHERTTAAVIDLDGRWPRAGPCLSCANGEQA